MSSREPLLQLRHLDKSSPKFNDELTGLLRGEEYRKDVSNLQGDDLVWLVDFLDTVRSHIALPWSPLNPL